MSAIYVNFVVGMVEPMDLIVASYRLITLNLKYAVWIKDFERGASVPKTTPPPSRSAPALYNYVTHYGML